MIAVGTAGWSVPRAAGGAFPGEGSHLERYARVLPCAEINSSFHRPHTHAVYARWAAATPPAFRFSVKVPRAITHEARLRRARRPLEVLFRDQVSGLGEKLGPVLVQLPPSLEFDPRVARRFFSIIREMHAGPLVCEPRHETWFGGQADDMMRVHRVARRHGSVSHRWGYAGPMSW